MNKTKIILILLMIIICVIGLILSKNQDNNSTLVETEKELETKIVLYFSNPENGELVKEYRYVNLRNIKDDAPGTIIKELLKGPETENLISAIPEGTTVNSINVDSNKIEVDFSKEYGNTSGDELMELQKIYSVVNSLTEITEINEVCIKVNGEILADKVRL